MVHSTTTALQHFHKCPICSIKVAQLLNLVDDNAIETFSNSADDLISELQKESENTIDWFRSNKMVVNSDKFSLL